MSDVRPYRTEVFTAPDGEPGTRLVPIWQDDYDELVAENKRLREALESIRNVGDRAAVLVAQAALTYEPEAGEG